MENQDEMGTERRKRVCSLKYLSVEEETADSIIYARLRGRTTLRRGLRFASRIVKTG